MCAHLIEPVYLDVNRQSERQRDGVGDRLEWSIRNQIGFVLCSALIQDVGVE